MINSVYRDELPVVYDPPKPQKIIPDEDDLYHSDKFAFGSKIGQITNKGSNGFAILPLIEELYGIDSEEYKITSSRLKQCCKAQSCQIDKTKIGKEVKDIPKLWVDYREIKDDDREDIKKEKEFYNSILLNKYPYFFKYRYHEAKRKYNQYINTYELSCRQHFQMSLNKLLLLKNKSDKQIEFIKKFYNYIPLTYSNSSMNLICLYIESVSFNISSKIKNDDFNDLYFLYKNIEYDYTEEIRNEIINIIKSHKKEVSTDFKWMSDEDKENEDNENEYIIESKVDSVSLFNKMEQVCSNVWIVVNCLIDYFYVDNPNYNKNILWNSYGYYIYKNVIKNTSDKVLFPFQSESGNINYLGKKYELQEVNFNR